jgi:glutamate synthase domain-containing protein 2
MRKEFFIACGIFSLVIVIGFFVLPEIYRPIHYTISAILMGIMFIGLKDALQKKQTIKRNFPVLGNFRYLLESIRPEIQQYFIEKNTDGKPFSREERSLVYQRAKGVKDTIPFGTQQDVYKSGYEWVNHSMMCKHVDPESLRVTIGNKDCKQPYSCSIFNISAMSFGSLSDAAVLALNGGAKDNNFAHNTGEGSISPYHLKPGGDLIWQIGTGYFGCRNPDGTFNAEKFKERANHENVKMIEIKISQGAKPGHGGILPKEKITPEIAQIRGVPMDRDVNSPPSHSAFSTPLELVDFIAQLRQLTNGKPVGFKLCVGKKSEFMAICKAMIEKDTYPDFISVDGAEGGTGAAPLEFSNSIGGPGIDGLVFVHNTLKGFDIRKHIKILTTGKITSGFDLIKRIALGADIGYSSRSMMLALGCIQALRCNANICPVGIATQDRNLVAGLVVDDKRKRVANYHRATVKNAAEILGAMGLESTTQLRPTNIIKRVGESNNVSYAEIFDYMEDGDFLNGKFQKNYERSFKKAAAHTFEAQQTS